MRTTVVLFLWAGYPSCYSTSGVRALQIEDCRKHEALILTSGLASSFLCPLPG